MALTQQPPRLDFSLFHPMDHLLLGRRCWRLPRGPQGHLQDWWDYRFEWNGTWLAMRARHLLLRQHTPSAWYRPKPEAEAPLPAPESDAPGQPRQTRRLMGRELELAGVVCALCRQSLPLQAAQAKVWPIGPRRDPGK